MATVPGVLALLFAALLALWLADRGNHSGTPHESYLRLRTRPIGASESHSAGRGQPLLEDNASQWLRASVEGYCSITSDAGDCGRGDKGTWVLPHEVVSEGWHRAAQACSTERLVTGQPARVCHPINKCVSVSICAGVPRPLPRVRAVPRRLSLAQVRRLLVVQGVQHLACRAPPESLDVPLRPCGNACGARARRRCSGGGGPPRRPRVLWRRVLCAWPATGERACVGATPSGGERLWRGNDRRDAKLSP